jgi:hypothetical protein
MILTIFMLIYILLLMLTSWFMWHRRNGQFIIYDVGSNPFLGKVLKTTSIALMLEAVLGLLLLFLAGRYYNLITLFLSCLTLLIFGLLINANKN